MRLAKRALLAHLFNDHQIVRGECPAEISSHDPQVTKMHMRKELAPSQVLGQRDGLALRVPASRGIQATRLILVRTRGW